MELQDKVDNLERRLKKQGRFLGFTTGLLFLTIGFLITQWILGIAGRLDLQGKRVYVHSREGSLDTVSTIGRLGFDAHSLDSPAEPYGKHARLWVLPHAGLFLGEDSSNRSPALQLFVMGNRSGLSIRDDKQKERVSLTVSEDGPKLLLLDENGQVLFRAP
jgi:hypothetical protein